MKKIFAVISLCILAAFLSIGWNSSKGGSDYQSKSFTVQKGGLLTVDVDPGAVLIESWQKDEVFVEAEGIDERHPDRLSIDQSGNNVSVKYRDTRHSTNNLKFIVKVPSSYNAEIHTSGGSIKQKNTLGGYFKAETGGGSVELDEVTGVVEVETKGGSIEGNKLGGDSKLKTGGGSIEIKTALASLNLRTGGGSIELGDVKGKTEASTGGGSVEVGNAGGPVELETGGGAIQINGANSGATVKTGGGGIELAGIHGYISAETSGGSISAELTPDAAGESTIKTGGGDISLSVPGNAKVTIEAKINHHGGWGHHKGKNRVKSDFKADLYEGGDEGGDIHAVYTLNGGGHKILLVTSDSEIEIRKLND